jgi:four helix bundle protein
MEEKREAGPLDGSQVWTNHTRSSLSELDTQLDLSRDLAFVNEHTRSEIDRLLTRIDKMLYALHRSKKFSVTPK